MEWIKYCYSKGFLGRPLPPLPNQRGISRGVSSSDSRFWPNLRIYIRNMQVFTALGLIELLGDDTATSLRHSK